MKVIERLLLRALSHLVSCHMRAILLYQLETCSEFGLRIFIIYILSCFSSVRLLINLLRACCVCVGVCLSVPFCVSKMTQL